MAVDTIVPTTGDGAVRTASGRLVVPGNRWDLVAPSVPASVSVVVPYYEDPAGLRRLLASLDAQDLRPTQVVVVDDGSVDHPAATVLADRPDVEVLAQPDRGFRAAAARNRGAEAATGEVVVFLDGDVVAAPDCLRHLVGLPAALPDALVVGRRRHADLAGATPPRAVELAAGHDGPGPWVGDPDWLADGYRRTRDLLDLDVRSWRLVIGAVLAIRRDTFLDVGGFDDAFVGYGGEDWEFAHRALHAGVVLAHAPDAVVVHDGPDLVGRGEEQHKERETRVLLPRIPDRTFRPPGLRGTVPRVVVRCHDRDWSAVARVRCLASLLDAWGDAVVQVEQATPDVLDLDPRIWPRSSHVAPHVEVVVDVHRPVLVGGDGVLALVDPGRADRVRVRLGDTDVLTVTGTRLPARIERAATDADEGEALWEQLARESSVHPATVGLDVLVQPRALEASFDRAPSPPVGTGQAWRARLREQGGPIAEPPQAAQPDRPILVAGVSWRCGSTLVQRLLSGSGEAWLWGEPYDRARPLHRLHEQLSAFRDGWPTGDHDVRPDDPGGAWIAVMSPVTAQLLAAQRAFVRTLLAPPRAGLRWGCKEVRFGHDELSWLLTLFPEARVVLVVRDPVRAWASYAANPGWAWRWPDERVHEPAHFARHWRRQAQGFLDLADDPRCRLVRLEDVVAGTGLDELGRHVGVTVDASALDHRLRGTSEPPEPVPTDVVDLVRATTAPVAARLGYPVEA